MIDEFEELDNLIKDLRAPSLPSTMGLLDEVKAVVDERIRFAAYNFVSASLLSTMQSFGELEDEALSNILETSDRQIVDNVSGTCDSIYSLVEMCSIVPVKGKPGICEAAILELFRESISSAAMDLFDDCLASASESCDALKIKEDGLKRASLRRLILASKRDGVVSIPSKDSLSLVEWVERGGAFPTGKLNGQASEEELN